MARFKSFEDFKDDFEEHHYIDKVSNLYYPKKSLNEKQLQRYYSQYARKWEISYGGRVSETARRQSLDSKISAIVRERDGGCRLLKILSIEENAEWQKNQNGFGGILDAAHVFGKSAFPWMRYDEKNVVVLNRFSHNCLDTGKSPINGKQITDEQRKEWWRKITGSDWEYLESQSICRGLGNDV
jgi:hypothetical protein